MSRCACLLYTRGASVYVFGTKFFIEKIGWRRADRMRTEVNILGGKSGILSAEGNRSVEPDFRRRKASIFLERPSSLSAAMLQHDCLNKM